MRLFLASNLTLRTLESTELDGLLYPTANTQNARAHSSLRWFASFSWNRVVFQILLIVLILGGALGSNVCAQDATAKPGDQQAFYSPKDRLEAMHGALLFVPNSVAGADIMGGPPRTKSSSNFTSTTK